MERISERTMRAYSGMATRPMATTAFSMPGPSAAMMAMARRMEGMASIMSMMRMMTVSHLPPL